MITPPYLKLGDKIAIIATARKVSKEEMQPAIDILTGWGLNVIEGKNLYKQQNQFAGSDEERLDDLQNVLDNREIKAVLFARGGYGTMRFADDIIFSKFIKNPKWLIGFSDITSLHKIAKDLKIETLHAPMAFNFAKTPPEILNQIKDILFGNNFTLMPASGITSNPLNRGGTAIGTLTGGNLSLLYAESAANPKLNFDDNILFMEDLDEYLYHLDRMMVSLKRSGKLMNLAGLIVGAMNDMRDNTTAFGFKTDNPFGKTAEEIISEHVAEYDYPVCFNFPAGHIQNNHPLIFGREVELTVGENIKLKYSH
ncbi:MAG TPA: LD-carboxypeptidase [Bacteroidia bacterium]|nr:LD-carboxypeptidase [Bacteroidia bacterium]